MTLGHAGRHVLVTGASRGIGLAIARAFAAEGARLTLVARDGARLEAAAGELRAEGGEAAALAADLSTDAGRAAVHAAAPAPDILVNNAGAIKAGRLSELSMEDWRTGWDLKVFGYIDMCRRYLPDMTDRGSGVILNITGMGGRAVRPSYICGAAGNAGVTAGASGGGSLDSETASGASVPAPSVGAGSMGAASAGAAAPAGRASSAGAGGRAAAGTGGTAGGGGTAVARWASLTGARTAAAGDAVSATASAASSRGRSLSTRRQ
ncbi:MAG: SDR family NAD(P)-dependent oxidoreductase [Alphaproteobacteria bacterium]|jgi:NAD(P)-dependent dehydrogenase (short-subunit alcohol dehydrogenase family)|nr:SDR family NAD(P)-dependent oxidoreductase [Alphaproteobacteria bacterium]